MASISPARAQRLALLIFAVSTCWVIIALYALDSALPANTLRLPLQKQLQLARIIPQGWGFFTRNPREPIVLVYRKSDGEWQPAWLGPQGRARYLFGFNRRPRAQGVELGLLFEDIPRDGWRSCRGSPAECLAEVQPLGAIENTSPRGSLCGLIGFVRREPVPWAWSRSSRPIVMPAEVLAMEVRC